MARSQLATKIEPIEVRTWERFEVKPLTGSFGARLDGVQIADALNDEALFNDIREAWLHYQVIFFREQELKPEEHLELGKKFGDIQKQGYAPSIEGLEGVWVQEYPDLYEGLVSDIDWHADSTFRATPTRGSLLYALDIPVGGDTVWADQCAAYNDLAPSWRGFLDGLTAIHDNMQRNLQHVIDSMDPADYKRIREYLPPSEHPVVCTHPETGRRFLFISELMTREICGMTRAESRAVMDFVFAHQTRPEYQCRFRWEPGSLAIWDNFSTLHRGIFDFGMGHRKMHRVSFNTPWKPA